MSNCELCGRNGELVLAFVEGAKFNVCGSCSKYGKVVQKAKSEFVLNKHESKFVDEFSENIVSDYNLLIKSAREKMNLSQKELALKLNERESVISSCESGAMKPGIELARKIGKFLNIRLVIKEKIAEFAKKKSSLGGALTIGDIIKK